MKYIPEVVALLSLSNLWGSYAYSEPRIGGLENIGCTTRQKMEDVSSRLSAGRLEEYDSALMQGCSIIKSDNSVTIEKTNDSSKVIVFFGEERIEMFVDKNFSAVR